MSASTYEPWHEQAACAGMDTRIFFPGLRGTKRWRQAMKTCASCPVRAECGDANKDAEFGIFGGVDQWERNGRVPQVRVKVA